MGTGIMAPAMVGSWPGGCEGGGDVMAPAMRQGHMGSGGGADGRGRGGGREAIGGIRTSRRGGGPGRGNIIPAFLLAGEGGGPQWAQKS